MKNPALVILTSSPNEWKCLFKCILYTANFNCYRASIAQKLNVEQIVEDSQAAVQTLFLF